MKVVQAAGAMDCAGQPAIAAGIARAALEASVSYTKQRVVVGPNTLANFDAVRCTIADMAAVVEAGERNLEFHLIDEDGKSIAPL